MPFFFQVVELNEKDGKVKLTCLGPDILGDNQQLQYTVEPNVWFGAFPTKDLSILPNGVPEKNPARDGEHHYSLVGCTCAPAFQFEDFELGKRSELISQFPDNELFVSLLTYPEWMKSCFWDLQASYVWFLYFLHYLNPWVGIWTLWGEARPMVLNPKP